jgi:hypothetical protein
MPSSDQIIIGRQPDFVDAIPIGVDDHRLAKAQYNSPAMPHPPAVSPQPALANVKLVSDPELESVMQKGFRGSLLESVPLLILLGVLAGALGGLAIGMIQNRSTSSSSIGR